MSEVLEKFLDKKTFTSAAPTELDEIAGFGSPLETVIGSMMNAMENKDVKLLLTDDNLDGLTREELEGVVLATLWKGAMLNLDNPYFQTEQLLDTDDFRILEAAYQSIDDALSDLRTRVTPILNDIVELEQIRNTYEKGKLFGPRIEEGRVKGNLKDAISKYAGELVLKQMSGDISSTAEAGGKPTPTVKLLKDEKFLSEYHATYPEKGPVDETWKIKPKIVLLHGVGRSKDEFKKTEDYYRSMGLDVVALDLIQHTGKGTKNDFDGIGRDVMQQLAEIDKDNPDQKYILVGQSLGGLVALQLLNNPEFQSKILGSLINSVPAGRGKEKGVAPSLRKFVRNVKEHPIWYQKFFHKLGVTLNSDTMTFLGTDTPVLFSVYDEHLETDYFDIVDNIPASKQAIFMVGTGDKILFFAGCDAPSAYRGAHRWIMRGRGHAMPEPEFTYPMLRHLVENLNNPALIVQNPTPAELPLAG